MLKIFYAFIALIQNYIIYFYMFNSSSKGCIIIEIIKDNIFFAKNLH